MNMFKRFLMSAMAATVMMSAGHAMAATSTREDLSRDANEAILRLTEKNKLAADINTRAKAVLVFPSIVKAGLVFGGAYGEGVLRQSERPDTYYNSITGSVGWQAGAQSYGYVVFLMNDKALKHLDDSKGWEIGVGPTVVLVNEGVAKNLSSTTLKDDAYAFIFDQKGLMAALSIEGTKITRIKD